ncbi:MAG: alpha/beta hydrolase, partial [Chloroflexaceae bacterium]|nr:alpha/beta hydrolase [Chloroflexaceae bacterium]
ASEEDFLDASELRSIRMPNGMIWGMADHFLPSGSFEFFCNNMPNLELLTLPGCGHLPQQEQPGAVVRFVQQFATRVGRRLTIDD